MKLLRKKLERLANRIMKKRNLKRKHRPRLYVFKSHKHIYAQIIDDKKHITVTTSSSLCPKLKQRITSSATCATATIVGQDIAKKLKDKGITKIIFDRGNKIYHGKIKALAEATRKEGIIF